MLKEKQLLHFYQKLIHKNILPMNRDGRGLYDTWTTSVTKLEHKNTRHLQELFKE